MDIMDHLSEILPVIVFLFWVIFGVIFKSAVQKKAKSPVQPRNEREERQKTPPKKRFGTNLKDALQMVLEEMDITERRNDELPESIPDKMDTKPQQQPSPEIIMAGLPEISVKSRRNENDEQPYRREHMHPYQEQNIRKADTYIPSGKVYRNELLRGIIWSEILSPPLSLREPR